MLNNSSRPLYRSCQLINFPSFGEEFVDWVLQKFQQIGIPAEKEAISYLKKIVRDTPNYIQMLAFHLVAEGYPLIHRKAVQEVLKKVIQQNAYAYQTLLSSLSPLQQRALRLAAKEEKHIFTQKFFTQEFLKKYEIPSAPALASSIKALKAKGILEEETTARGVVTFDDPLFAIWLKGSLEDADLL